MKLIKQLLRVLAIIAMSGVSLIVATGLLLAYAPYSREFLLLVGRLIGGFWFFLCENFPAISWDAGTWGPGVGAFLLALALAHPFLKPWAARTNRHWSFASSFCLLLTVPVMFVVAFIIPGVLLQWEILRHTPWIDLR
jgi:hypothetical protein